MATLRETYRLLFPDAPRRISPFKDVPVLPADVFAFTAYILDGSGAYHHIAPETGASGPGRNIIISQVFRSRAVRVGKEWRSTKAAAGRLPAVPPRVKKLWNELVNYQEDEVFVLLKPEAATPDWWRIVIELLMIADEASQELGFNPDNPFFEPIAEAFAVEDVVSGREFRRLQEAPTTFSTADSNVVNVMAKSRTPSVGCTLRSFSHHLAMLPGQGSVRARWVTSPFSLPASKAETLGLLLVPLPYKLHHSAFVARGDHKGRWGWFDVEQQWLPDSLERRREFVNFITGLVHEARQDGRRVDGIVLPELALNYRQFRMLASALARHTKVDFLISGLSDTRDGRQGNFVAIAPFFLFGEVSDRKHGLEQIFLIREKHHRWKLTKDQIEAYGLEDALDVDRNWWEHLDLLERRLDLFVYRGGTSLTTMICEDLARVDPCQSVLRSIGPNLVIALLMDGPQLNGRWPARYATVLADDPGSSVLTFTSLGLIERQNEMKKFAQSSTIALWKDESNGIVQLDLPRDADALYLQLNAETKTEHTLDGRPDEANAHRWVLKDRVGIASDPAGRPTWIKTGRAR